MSMSWKQFTSAFGLIFLAELPDKTAMATLVLATQGDPWPIFTGVAAAFVAQTAIAVAFGGVLSFFPLRWIHLATGFAFFVFAYLSWQRATKTDPSKPKGSPAVQVKRFWAEAIRSFWVIFIAEWGDLTQFASASLVARFRAPVTIFASSVLALWLVSALAIAMGNRAQRWIKVKVLEKIAAAAFVGAGIYFCLN